MGRPQPAHRSPRENFPPKRARSQRPNRWREWAFTWAPLIVLLTVLALAPFWLVRLMGWLIAR
jgi:hypothetical protein